MAAWYDVAIDRLLTMLTEIAEIVKDAVAKGMVNEDAPKRAQANQAVARLTVAVQHLSEALAALRQYAQEDKKEDPEEKLEEGLKE